MSVPTQNHRYTLMGIATAVIVLIAAIGTWHILSDPSCDDCAVYYALAYAVIMLWTLIFVNYFIWATFFYNLGYGVSQGVWDKISDHKERKSNSQPYSQHILDDEPLYNPYSDQTFGLPPGTVRGMIAFTLLFGAISMLIVSFGLKNEISPNTIIYDHYDFFKTAFLMMIAFYFGDRSLKYLKDNKNQTSAAHTTNTRKAAIDPTDNPPTSGGNQVASGGNGSDPAPSSPTNILTINPADDDKEIEVDKDGQKVKIKAITPIDPMSSSKK